MLKRYTTVGRVEMCCKVKNGDISILLGCCLTAWWIRKQNCEQILLDRKSWSEEVRLRACHRIILQIERQQSTSLQKWAIVCLTTAWPTLCVSISTYIVFLFYRWKRNKLFLICISLIIGAVEFFLFLSHLFPLPWIDRLHWEGRMSLQGELETTCAMIITGAMGQGCRRQD